MSLKLQDMEHTIQLSLGNIVAVTGTTHSQVHSIVYSCHYKTTAHKAYKIVHTAHIAYSTVHTAHLAYNTVHTAHLAT